MFGSWKFIIVGQNWVTVRDESLVEVGDGSLAS